MVFHKGVRSWFDSSERHGNQNMGKHGQGMQATKTFMFNVHVYIHQTRTQQKLENYIWDFKWYN